MWFTIVYCAVNMLISLRSRFIAVFTVGLFIIIAYKLIESKQRHDAEQNAEQNTNSSDNSLIFVHSVGVGKFFVKISVFFYFDIVMCYFHRNAKMISVLFFICCAYTQICRHGSRNIIASYPTDPFQNKTLFWPEGYGQLTNVMRTPIFIKRQLVKKT